MKMPFWLLRLLPMWEYICPKCREEVPKNCRVCPHCGEKYPLPLKVPPSFLRDQKKLEAYVHQHIFPRVSEFERNYLTKYFTTIFEDRFENGFTPWTGTRELEGTASVTSGDAHHGTYKFTSQIDAWGEYAVVNKNLGANYTEIYARAYMKANATPNMGTGYSDMGIGLFASGYPSGGIAYAIFKPTTNKWGVLARVNNVWTEYFESGTSTFSTNTYYCIELYLKAAASGAFSLWIDGIQKIDETNKNASSEGTIRYVEIGWAYITANIQNDVNFDFDCIVVADEGPIGPEEEGPTLVEVADSLELTETVLRNKTLILSDSLALADALYGNKSLLLSDSASLSELITVIIGEVMKYVTDSVSSADLASTPSRVLRVLDVIGAADNVAVNKVLQITETVSLAEIVGVSVGGVKKTRLFLILGGLAVQLTGD